MTLSRKLIEFYFNLKLIGNIPDGIEVMNPYVDPHVKEVCSQFFNKYYNDNRQRIMIMGINPGRFGAGITGITFTDPVQLESACGIQNSFNKKPELSSVFIYEMIKTFGGISKFYRNYFITAVSPLGFVRNGKNLNYYDDKILQESLNDFIIDTITTQLDLGFSRKVVICLGEGKNYKYLSDLNNEYDFFEEIIPLPHPRWIMQYRYKRKEEFVDTYVRTLLPLVNPL